jgi:hypothetical protein
LINGLRTPKLAKFPVYFPVSREFERRRVRTSLRPPPSCPHLLGNACAGNPCAAIREIPAFIVFSRRLPHARPARADVAPLRFAKNARRPRPAQPICSRQDIALRYPACAFSCVSFLPSAESSRDDWRNLKSALCGDRTANICNSPCDEAAILAGLPGRTRAVSGFCQRIAPCLAVQFACKHQPGPMGG